MEEDLNKYSLMRMDFIKQISEEIKKSILAKKCSENKDAISITELVMHFVLAIEM